jgi:hypothetical protein
MLNSSNSQAEYEDLHGIQGEIFMNIQTASNLNSRSSCLKHFDAEETGAQDLWSGAKCWMLGHWGLAILPRERVQPTNHAMEPIWQRSRARGQKSMEAPVVQVLQSQVTERPALRTKGPSMSKLLAAQCQNVSKLHCTNSSSSLSCGRRTDRTKDALSEEAKVNLSTVRAGLSRDCIHDVICVFLPRPAVENLCL